MQNLYGSDYIKIQDFSESGMQRIDCILLMKGAQPGGELDVYCKCSQLLAPLAWALEDHQWPLSI